MTAAPVSGQDSARKPPTGEMLPELTANSILAKPAHGYETYQATDSGVPRFGGGGSKRVATGGGGMRPQ